MRQLDKHPSKGTRTNDTQYKYYYYKYLHTEANTKDNIENSARAGTVTGNTTTNKEANPLTDEEHKKHADNNIHA